MIENTDIKLRKQLKKGNMTNIKLLNEIDNPEGIPNIKMVEGG